MEVMVVVAIIGILATMMTSVVTSGRRQARQTDCKANLRQMGVAILVYRGEHNGANPPWLSAMYPEYLDDRRVFVCKSDRSKGEGVVRPADLPDKAEPGKFAEVIDNRSVADRLLVGQNDQVLANSYFYEFSDAACSWSAGLKWWEAKENQLRYGDDANGGGVANPVPYSQSKLPIVRCYHHHRESRMQAYADLAAKRSRTLAYEGITINVAYAGNVYVGPLWWEGMPDPGERDP